MLDESFGIDIHLSGDATCASATSHLVEAIGVTVDADCVAAVAEAARRLEALGHHVEPRHPPRLFDEEFATHHPRSVGWEFQHMLDGSPPRSGGP